jgi:hypothetical protein
VADESAVAREAAWLALPGDSTLPGLLEAAGGPWELVQPYYGRSPAMRKRSVFVMRERTVETRLGGLRKTTRHDFRLVLRWPSKSRTGDAEADQSSFDAAVDLLLARIRGPVGDHTHGGRFLSVGENPGQIQVDFTPAEQTLGGEIGGDNPPHLAAVIRYSADDEQINS